MFFFFPLKRPGLSQQLRYVLISVLHRYWKDFAPEMLGLFKGFDVSVKAAEAVVSVGFFVGKSRA